MRIAAGVATVVVLGAYLTLMRLDPSYGWLQPRGGVVTLSISLLLANAGIWLAGDPQRSLRRRFEFAFAGWLWLLVQAGGLAWLCSVAR